MPGFLPVSNLLREYFQILFFLQVISLIIGIGVDIIEAERVKRLIERFANRFGEKIFTPREVAYCRRFRDSGRCYAARFAAKEAVFKALGTGLTQGVKWREVEVVNFPGGSPEVFLSGRTAALAKERGVQKVLLSLSHGKSEAIAFVLLEGGP